MRGHLTERRPGVWRIVISNGFDDSGKRRQIVRTVNGSKRSAERELTKMLREFDRGTLAEGRQPLRVYLESDWLPSVSGTSKRGRPLAPTTRARYADAVDHISRHIGAVRLDELRSTHVERLRDRLLAEGRLGPQTIAVVLRVLAQALSRAEAKTLVGKNWADPRLVNRPVGASGDFVVIDATLAGTILEAVRVLGLRWSDVDESVGPDKSGVVRVRQTLTYAAGEYHFGPPKSQAGERDIQLPDFVERSLRRHRAAQGKRLLAIGMVSELVVDDGMGGPWMPASFSTGWRRFAKRNGFDRITFHTLRHGAATLLLAAGVSDAVAINIMGHADTKILGRYQDVVGELKRDAAARLDSVFGGGGGI
jgi:integrase